MSIKTIRINIWLKLTILLSLAFYSHLLSAQSDISKDFGEYRVYYSVFNSTFLTPKVAAAYGFTRAKDQALINISLIRQSSSGNSLGLPTQVSGKVTNLIGQSTSLNFKEIQEGDATYYLAAFTFADQDPLNFDIDVRRNDSSVPYQIQFTRTLYAD